MHVLGTWSEATPYQSPCQGHAGCRQLRLIPRQPRARPETNPVWSPDGCRIAFTSDRHVKRYKGERWGPDFELYLMRVNGTRIRRLTRNSVPDLLPDWQPIPR